MTPSLALLTSFWISFCYGVTVTFFLAKVYKHVNCCIRCYTNKKLFGIKKNWVKDWHQHRRSWFLKHSSKESSTFWWCSQNPNTRQSFKMIFYETYLPKRMLMTPLKPCPLLSIRASLTAFSSGTKPLAFICCNSSLASSTFCALTKASKTAV